MNLNNKTSQEELNSRISQLEEAVSSKQKELDEISRQKEEDKQRHEQARAALQLLHQNESNKKMEEISLLSTSLSGVKEILQLSNDEHEKKELELQNSIQQLEAKNEQKSGEVENLKGALHQMQLERDGLSKQSEA